MDWNPDMSAAPRDGTFLRAKVGRRVGIIAWMDGLLDDDMRLCGGWYWADLDTPAPACWTDDVCWATNADGVPSAKPTAWMPLAPAPAATDISERR